MRAVDDPTPIYIAVLQKLQIWGPLPESDITRMLNTFHLVTNDYREIEESGYILLTFSGDEYILEMTDLGRIFLEREEQRFPKER